MWNRDEAGIRHFLGGQEDWLAARAAANLCQGFSADVEEECCDDEALSCYNCRYRRWTADSFACMAERIAS